MVLAINGVGVGTMYPFTTVVIQNAVEPHRFGIATGTLNFFRQLGGAIIVAVFVAIVLGGLEGGEGARLLETLTAHGAGGAARTAGAAQFAPLFRWCSCARRVSSRRRWSRCCWSRSARCADRRRG